MSFLNVSLIQCPLHWESPEANRKSLEEHISKLEETDLIVLPEMFTTAFSMDSARLAESMDGPSVRWMRKQAEALNAVICGSLIIEENGNYYNRLVWMKPDGEYQSYDKRHLFRMAKEEAYFSNGSERLIVELKGWKICPLVCYDLRFPVWSRNQFHMEENQLTAAYDMLVYVANWPAARTDPWEKLLLARAIENQAFVVGLNRIGEDGKGITYEGASAIIDPKGEYLWKGKSNQIAIHTQTIDLGELEQFRQKFPVGLDADPFKLVDISR